MLQSLRGDKMLYKKRDKPLAMLGLQALLNRLPKGHEQYARIAEELRKRQAGFAGEENFDRHIKEFRPSYPYGLLHDVCLNYDGVFFQMDSLLLTPANIIIFEIKNLAGKITVKANPTQFIQETNGVRKAIQSPIIELDRKKIFLNKWLEKRGVTIPIKGMVGLAFTNELFIEEELDTTITFTHEIPILLYNAVLEAKSFGKSEIVKIATEMIKGHHEYNPFPMTRMMDIPKSDILPGVICPGCNHRGMNWQEKKWACRACGLRSIDSHLELINEWFYLMDAKITNINFRSFASIENRHVSKRLLQNAGLQMIGNRKATKYVRNPLT